MAKRQEVGVSAYTLRRTWPDEPDRPDDYVFRFGGKDEGRCYLRSMAHNESRWHWTVYGTNRSGRGESLDAAKIAFKDAVESVGKPTTRINFSTASVYCFCLAVPALPLAPPLVGVSTAQSHMLVSHRDHLPCRRLR